MNTFRSKDGTPIAYERSGSGSPLLLVHGSMADHTRWAPLLPALGQHFTVYTLDRRGRGGSGDAPDYAIEREFEDVACAVDHIGGPVDVLGHSSGGLYALEAARLTPNIRKLVLYEPASPGQKGGLPPQAEAAVRARLSAGDKEGAAAAMMREMVKGPDELERMKASPSWAGRVEAASMVLREVDAITDSPAFDPERWKAFQTPTLLLLGGESPAPLRDFTEALQATLPNSKIAILAGQGHIAMNTAPELFLSTVIGFLVDTNQGQA